MHIIEYSTLLTSHLFAIPSIYWCYKNKFVYEATTLCVMFGFSILHYSCDVFSSMCFADYEYYLLIDYLLSNQMIMTFFIYLLNIQPLELKFLPNYLSFTFISSSLILNKDLDNLPIETSIGIVSLGAFLLFTKLILLFMSKGYSGLSEYFKIYHVFDIVIAMFCFCANTFCYWMFIQTHNYIFYSLWHIFVYIGTWCLLTSYDNKKMFLCCNRTQNSNTLLHNNTNSNSSTFIIS